MAAVRVAILGAGSMGTALAALLERGGCEVRLWCRDAGRAESFRQQRENQRHLPGIKLGAGIEISADGRGALEGCDLIVAAVPCAFLRVTLQSLAEHAPAGVPAFSVVKGIERETFLRPSQIVSEALGDREVAVLSGPNHAEELARGKPASSVLAGENEEGCVWIRSLLMGETFRVYLNRDVAGVELAGALKNILGLAAGICDGLGFGDNAKAALLTRGLVEMSRFAVSLGASPATFWGLAGVGDVLTTCYSPFGRNRAVGMKIGKGESLEQVLAGMHDVAEGVYTTASAWGLARQRGVEMPITQEVHAILFEGKSPQVAVTDLMLRDPKFE